MLEGGLCIFSPGFSQIKNRKQGLELLLLSLERRGDGTETFLTGGAQRSLKHACESRPGSGSGSAPKGQ